MMSAVGTFRTCRPFRQMSVLGAKAEVTRPSPNCAIDPNRTWREAAPHLGISLQVAPVGAARRRAATRTQRRRNLTCCSCIPTSFLALIIGLSSLPTSPSRPTSGAHATTRVPYAARRRSGNAKPTSPGYAHPAQNSLRSIVRYCNCQHRAVWRHFPAGPPPPPSRASSPASDTAHLLPNQYHWRPPLARLRHAN